MRREHFFDGFEPLGTLFARTFSSVRSPARCRIFPRALTSTRGRAAACQRCLTRAQRCLRTAQPHRPIRNSNLFLTYVHSSISRQLHHRGSLRQHSECTAEYVREHDVRVKCVRYRSSIAGVEIRCVADAPLWLRLGMCLPPSASLQTAAVILQHVQVPSVSVRKMRRNCCIFDIRQFRAREKMRRDLSCSEGLPLSRSSVVLDCFSSR